MTTQATTIRAFVFLAAAAALLTAAAAAPAFRPDDPGAKYWTPGDLKPGSGDGVPQNTVEVTGMRFPFERAPAYANSQLYAHGGGEGPKPLTWNQKHPSNFSYPWRDNFCEKRGKLTQVEELCPAKKGGHQGQDIRAASATRNMYWAVAAVNGKISKDNPLGSSSTLDVKSTNQSQFFRYLHLFDDVLGSETLPNAVTLPTRRALGSKVTRGDRVGLVSAIMRYTKPNGVQVKYGTTTHLHFEIWEAGPDGFYCVPPYSSLVDSYHRLLISQPPPP
jgi:hypothetical protein